MALSEFEVVRGLSDSVSDPVVHVARPDRAIRGHSARWLVVSADGIWLAAGTAITRSRGLPHVTCEMPLPSGAFEAIQMATAKALDRWHVILADEERTREWVANRKANLVAAKGRRDTIDAEIAALEEDIADAERTLGGGYA